MATVRFSPNFRKHVACPDVEVPGRTVREALDAATGGTDELRGYVFDERDAVRKHVAIFLNDAPVVDRLGLADPVGPDDEIWVVQALSGG